MVVPDNVLFADQAGEVFEVLMEDCDVHTVLRCPRGTFSPYTEGTKTNVIFFTKGRPTKRTWIYDARANVPKITKTQPAADQTSILPSSRLATAPIRTAGARAAKRTQPKAAGELLTLDEIKAAPLQARRFQMAPR